MWREVLITSVVVLLLMVVVSDVLETAYLYSIRVEEPKPCRDEFGRGRVLEYCEKIKANWNGL